MAYFNGYQNLSDRALRCFEETKNVIGLNKDIMKFPLSFQKDLRFTCIVKDQKHFMVIQGANVSSVISLSQNLCIVN